MKPELKPPPEAILASVVSSSAELVARLLTLGLSVLTARLLQPTDIGVLGLAVMVSAIVSMIGSYAETAGVIARSPSSDAALSGAAALWRGGVTLVLILFLHANLARMAALVATGATSYFEQLAGLMLLVPAIESLAAHPRVLLQRRLRLRLVVALQFVQALAFVGMGAALVLAGYGVWGVVWAQIFSSSLATGAFWAGVLRSDQAVPTPSRDATRAVGRSAARLFTGGFAGFLSERVDNFLVGGALGPASMSFYSMAWTASRTPVFMLSRALNAVMLPMYIGSGIFFSAERFPKIVQPAIEVLPLTPLIHALRSIMLEGTSLLSLGTDVAAIVAWGCVAFALGLRWFRWN